MSGEITWPCHVCGDERPDSCISVHKRDDSEAFGRPEGTLVQNIRYCNDRPACRAGAASARLPTMKTGGSPSDFMEVKST